MVQRRELNRVRRVRYSNLSRIPSTRMAAKRALAWNHTSSLLRQSWEHSNMIRTSRQIIAIGMRAARNLPSIPVAAHRGLRQRRHLVRYALPHSKG